MTNQQGNEGRGWMYRGRDGETVTIEEKLEQALEFGSAMEKLAIENNRLNNDLEQTIADLRTRLETAYETEQRLYREGALPADACLIDPNCKVANACRQGHSGMSMTCEIVNAAEAIPAYVARLETAERELGRCGKENCFGLDVDGVASWVRKSRLEAAEQLVRSMVEAQKTSEKHWRAEVEAAEKALKEYDQLFEMQYKRDIEASLRWQAEDPTGRAMMLPDRGNLLDYLWAELQKAEQRLAAVEAALQYVRLRGDGTWELGSMSALDEARAALTTQPADTEEHQP